MRSKRYGKGKPAAESFIHQRGGYKIFSQPAILLRYRCAKQSLLPGLVQQGGHELRLQLVDPFYHRQHFCFYKRAAHLHDHLLLLGKIFRYKNAFRQAFPDDPFPPFQ